MNSLIRKIGLGSVQFGLNYGISNYQGITGLAEVRNILVYAKTIGVELIDTAYGYGKSEEVLGQAGNDPFKIVTKFLPATPEITIEDQVKSSLKRLNVGSVYGLLAHRPLTVAENPKIWDYMKQLQQEKIVLKIGFSFNLPEEAEIILKTGFVPDLIQVPFNYLDNRFIPYMIHFKNKGCEIHSRSTFLQGLFFSEPDTLSYFFDEIKPLLRNLQMEGKNLSGMLLGYSLEQSFIDKVIVGVNNKDQLVQNINSIYNYHKLPKLGIKVNKEILSPSNWPKS
jgi:aryl-alcohol dehydrogenase-like predicted oxidoreductase